MSDFDWYGDEDVIVEEQQPITCYKNGRGHAVIRQRGDLNFETYEFQDAWITVAPRHAAELARAILALAKPEPAPAPLALPAPGDRTAAERQRRHRERKRNSPCDRDTVTSAVTPNRDSNGHTDLLRSPPAD
jgi:hypothetical protein